MCAMCSKGGYLQSFGLYLGKNENKVMSSVETVPNVGLVGNIVLKLIKSANLPPH